MLYQIISHQLLFYFGLSRFHFHVILITIAISLVLGLILMIRKFGVFKQVQFRVQTMRECRIIYCNHRGAYQNLGRLFTRLSEIFGHHFKISKMFGIYYDNPQKMQNKNMCRSSIGIIINQGQSNKVKQFFQQNPSFETTMLPATKIITTHMPYVNQLSFFLLPFKVYPRFKTYIENMGIKTGEKTIMMEKYHFLAQHDKEIQVICILQNQQRFQLWEDDQDLIVDRKNMRRL